MHAVPHHVRMPSYLTRQVFRRLLANEPIAFRGCQRRNLHTGSALLPQAPQSRNHVVRGIVHQRRAAFSFNFLGRKAQAPGDPKLDPGIEKMMELAKRERMNARLPPPEEVAAALANFFRHKKNKGHGIEDTQAQLALQSLRYFLRSCEEAGSTAESKRPIRAFFSQRKLEEMLLVLNQSIPNASNAHCELARLIHEEAHDQPLVRQYNATSTYVRILCHLGQLHRAQEIINGFESALKASNNLDDAEMEPDAEEVMTQSYRNGPIEKPSNKFVDRINSLWTHVLKGHARDGNEGELLSILGLIRDRGLNPGDWAVRAAVFDFYMRKNDVSAAKEWFSEFWQAARLSTTGNGFEDQAIVLQDVLQWCLEKDHLDLGHEIVRQILDTNPQKPAWDAVFLWAVGCGKGADEIDRMFSVMEASNAQISDESQWRRPDVDTINHLVKFAVSKKDPYLAERFITLGKARNIEPNAQTYVLQMDYRLSVNDLDGALTAYMSLQSMDLSSNEDVSTVNKLIVALCHSKRHDFDTIMNVVADLTDRHARFEPATVSTLCVLHLNRDELADVVDLLNTHSYQYSFKERLSVRNTLVDFCIDPKTSTARAWDTYSVLKDIFDEMQRDYRTEIMLSFFRRQRPDMAANIFLSMRTHSRADTIPDVETYVSTLLAIAKLRDEDVLDVIHNQLKLDYNIDVNTYLNNALIIAYTACGRGRDALDFWNNIVASREGPSYNSIHIALRACEKSPFGDVKAQEIWNKLRSMNVELDSSMWASYAAALAGNGDIEFATRTVEEAEHNNEVEVDAFLLGSVFDGCPGQSKQTEVEDWCKEKYPQIWNELLKIGESVDEVGMRKFNIDRRVTP